MRERGADPARIRAAFAGGVDLLLYGCEVAQGAEGWEFMAMLADATGAQVAASTNLTGDAGQGGDWLLERRTGPLRSAAVAFPSYRHVLPSVAGTLSIDSTLANNTFTVPKFLDSNLSAQTHFPNIEYEIYFADVGNTPTGNVTNFNLGARRFDADL